ESVYLLKTAYVFDVSLSELFGWLAGGGKLAILPAGDEKDPAAIQSAIAAYGVTHINFVPSLFALFLDVLKQGGAAVQRLEYIFVAGEAFPEHLAQELQACGWADSVYNLYGPTECSVYATAFAMKDYRGGPVPIGLPLPNVEVY
ncbi:AMP-binding protein, partial [Chitinophaga qingshengii]